MAAALGASQVDAFSASVLEPYARQRIAGRGVEEGDEIVGQASGF
jgi:hypothetical protein